MFGQMRAGNGILPRKNHKRNAIDPKLARHFDIIGNLPVKGWIGKAGRINGKAVFMGDFGKFIIIANIAAINEIGFEKRVA